MKRWNRVFARWSSDSTPDRCVLSRNAPVLIVATREQQQVADADLYGSRPVVPLVKLDDGTRGALGEVAASALLDGEPEFHMAVPQWVK